VGDGGRQVGRVHGADCFRVAFATGLLRSADPERLGVFRGRRQTRSRIRS
jgi:hypothetical protein